MTVSPDQANCILNQKANPGVWLHAQKLIATAVAAADDAQIPFVQEMKVHITLFNFRE